jgi:hypothetical protein
MRVFLSSFLLLFLTGCMSVEQRMIALAKEKCADRIREWPGPLSWTAERSFRDEWRVEGAQEPRRNEGVIFETDGLKKMECGTFKAYRYSPGPTQP